MSESLPDRERAELPREPSFEEFHRRVREAAGDPRQISALVKSLALGVIGEIREGAERDEA